MANGDVGKVLDAFEQLAWSGDKQEKLLDISISDLVRNEKRELEKLGLPH